MTLDFLSFLKKKKSTVASPKNPNPVRNIINSYIKRTKELEIDVTDRHILKGRKGDCFECPIALAIHEKFDSTVVIIVGVQGGISIHTTHLLNNELGTLLLRTSYYNKQLHEFISAFDDGEEVKPFKFTMNIPLSLTERLRK